MEFFATLLNSKFDEITHSRTTCHGPYLSCHNLNSKLCSCITYLLLSRPTFGILCDFDLSTFYGLLLFHYVWIGFQYTLSLRFICLTIAITIVLNKFQYSLGDFIVLFFFGYSIVIRLKTTLSVRVVLSISDSQIKYISVNYRYHFPCTTSGNKSKMIKIDSW